jgi:hypothetical protein
VKERSETAQLVVAAKELVVEMRRLIVLLEAIVLIGAKK